MSTNKKKNILILHTDQQRYDSLGCNGNPYAKTPNIDALAKDGIRFSRHIASNPVCMPSRASLMTGMTVPGHGVSLNGVPLWRIDKVGIDEKNQEMIKKMIGSTIPDKLPTLADILTENGYDTAALGKLHLQPHLSKKEYGFEECYSAWEDEEMEKWEGPYYGFKKVKLIMSHGEALCGSREGHYGRWLRKTYPEEARKIDEKTYRTNVSKTKGDIYHSSIPVKLHNSTWLADETINYIEQRKECDEPFFAFVGFPDPHHPFTPPSDLAKDFMDIEVLEPAPYDERVKRKPQYVQNILKSQVSMEDIKMAARNTAAMVSLIDTSVGRIIQSLKDNGLYNDTIIIFTSDHGDFMGDYRQLHKCAIASAALVHIPFILKPCNNNLPSVMNIPMSNADVVPTLLAMVSIDIPKHIQGKDIFSVTSTKHTPMTHCYNLNQEAASFSIFNDSYRYTLYPTTGEEELYDHREDPQELNNLAFNPSWETRKICDELKTILLEMHIKADTRIYGKYAPW